MSTLHAHARGVRTDFEVEVGDRSPGFTLPQKVGRLLALPMLAMALMAFAAALAVGVVRADAIADGGAADRIAALQHVTAGLMFLGFASVFAAVAFAIARILGRLREGGGDVQATARARVQTLRMPLTAKAFLATMAMAMMTILVAVVLHFAFAADIENTGSSLALSEDRFVVLEAVRRIGVAIYLFSIVLGLATIVRVLCLQSVRIRELPAETARS
jgi:hypothetical protein